MRYLDITTEDKAKALATLSSEDDQSAAKRQKPSGATPLELCSLFRKCGAAKNQSSSGGLSLLTQAIAFTMFGFAMVGVLPQL